METVKTVYTSALKYAKRIRIVKGEYEDGSLYIGLYTMSGEPYCDITTNVFNMPKPWGTVLANSEAEAFVKEQNLGWFAYLVYGNCFNTYHTYDFKI